MRYTFRQFFCNFKYKLQIQLQKKDQELQKKNKELAKEKEENQVCKFVLLAPASL
jgi:hypothetical protein